MAIGWKHFTYTKVESYKSQYHHYPNKLSKPIAKQRQQHGIRISNKIESVEFQLPEFLPSKKVLDKVKEADKHLEEMSHNINHRKLLTAYMASISVYKMLKDQV